MQCDLVKNSTSWSADKMGFRSLARNLTCLRTKWQSISMCLVRSYKTSLWEILIALMLSQYRGMGCLTWMLVSQRMNRSQTTSEMVWARAWYLASTEEWETIDCFMPFPRDQGIAKTETCSKSTIKNVSGTIGIRVSSEGETARWGKKDPLCYGMLKVPKDS